MVQSILIIEDNLYTSGMVGKYLERNGYRIITAADGPEGLRLAMEENPSLVLLDVMLPGIDGMTVCRKLREKSSVPVIMLTARISEDDRVTGLEYGADDYITKPFGLRELVARIRAVLRRLNPVEPEPPGSILTCGSIVLDAEKRSVFVSNEELSLTSTEFRLLRLFMQARGKTFTREEIIAGVFDIAYDGYDRSVDAHVSRLRRKLRKSGCESCIRTVYGGGYRFGDE
ncbi:MAG: response regulator transcription factor [Dehalococcoidales bacterium]|nr:response regulator transcription factor [Dehalococcoidales bacterium]